MKTLTNLEFKRDGQKNNAIVSRETLGQSKQITALQEENGIFKYKTADGVKLATYHEIFDLPIATTDWEAFSYGGYKFRYSKQFPFIDIQGDVILTLLNNNVKLFNECKFGFEATDVSQKILTFYAVKKPTQDVVLSIEKVVIG